MARPVQADAGATRARILEAAGTSFAERGMGNTSIRSIAADAEVSLAMVHHYFGSKGGLYEACIAQMYDQLGELQAELSGGLAETGDLGEAIERAVRLGFRFGREHQVAGRLLFREIASLGQLDEARQRARQGPFLDQASAALSLLTGRPADRLRLPLQSAVILVARYAISSDAELALFTNNAADPVAATEDHLVAAIRNLLTPSASSQEL
jgi:AcrR family transcriptional regulator